MCLFPSFRNAFCILRDLLIFHLSVVWIFRRRRFLVAPNFSIMTFSTTGYNSDMATFSISLSLSNDQLDQRAADENVHARNHTFAGRILDFAAHQPTSATCTGAHEFGHRSKSFERPSKNRARIPSVPLTCTRFAWFQFAQTRKIGSGARDDVSNDPTGFVEYRENSRLLTARRPFFRNVRNQEVLLDG